MITGTQPIKVTWIKDDEVLQGNDRLQIREETSRGKSQSSKGSSIRDSQHWLQFEEVTPEDSGLYFCEAYNQHGEAYSYCRLKVMGEYQGAAGRHKSQCCKTQ